MPAVLIRLVEILNPNSTPTLRVTNWLLVLAQPSRIEHTTADQYCGPKGEQRGRFRGGFMVVTMVIVIVLVAVVIVFVTIVIVFVAVAITIPVLIFVFVHIAIVINDVV